MFRRTINKRAAALCRNHKKLGPIDKLIFANGLMKKGIFYQVKSQETILTPERSVHPDDRLGIVFSFFFWKLLTNRTFTANKVSVFYE